MEGFMKGINRGMAVRGGSLRGKELMEALSDMTRQSEKALNDLSIFMV